MVNLCWRGNSLSQRWPFSLKLHFWSSEVKKRKERWPRRERLLPLSLYPAWYDLFKVLEARCQRTRQGGNVAIEARWQVLEARQDGVKLKSRSLPLLPAEIPQSEICHFCCDTICLMEFHMRQITNCLVVTAIFSKKVIELSYFR